MPLEGFYFEAAAEQAGSLCRWGQQAPFTARHGGFWQINCVRRNKDYGVCNCLKITVTLNVVEFQHPSVSASPVLSALEGRYNNNWLNFMCVCLCVGVCPPYLYSPKFKLEDIEAGGLGKDCREQLSTGLHLWRQYVVTTVQLKSHGAVSFLYCRCCRCFLEALSLWYVWCSEKTTTYSWVSFGL